MKDTVKVEISGLKELQDKLSRMSPDATKEAERALLTVVTDLRGKAADLAPVDTGDLRGSAFAEVNGLQGVAGFQEQYALKQHNHVEYRHPKGGKALYLEEPYQDNRDKYIDYIVKVVKAAVEK